MSSRRANYELIAECKPEWSTSYVFINKQYQFNIYLSNKTKKSKRNKKPRTNLNSTDCCTNSVDSETFNINVLCIDNDSKPLSSSQHQILPSSTIHLGINDYYSFTVSIHKLSMNHGDSQFRLFFQCDSNNLNCNIANDKFICVRVINYKFSIISIPHQLHNDDYKFYKDVKPKTNFLQYEICLINSNGKRCKPPRKVPIKCVIYFENGRKSPNQNALNLKGINTIYNEPYKLNERGAVTVPLRIEETSTKYENRKFQIKFIADYEKITSNLDIAPVFSEPFLVRTKINKYRIKNKEHKKKPGRKKKIKIKEIKNETAININTHTTDHDASILPSQPPTLPMHLSLPSFIMPPLFATAPGMNMIQIDGTETVSINNVLNGLSLPPLIDSNSQRNHRKRNIDKAGIDTAPLLPNKRQKLSAHRRGPITRSMTYNSVSGESENENEYENRLDNVENYKYGFDENTSDKILEPMIIETLRMLGEAIGRREYFVSGSECICYLKCLFCGSTAYPPKEKRVKHVKGCLLSVLYQNITQCVSPRVLLQAFDLNPPDLSGIDASHINETNRNTKRNDGVRLLNMANSSIPPNSMPQIPSIVEPEGDIAPYTRRNSSGSFGLVRSDRCTSFNGFIAPFNTLLDITPTPTQQNIPDDDNVMSQNMNGDHNHNGRRSRSNSYKLVPVSFPTHSNQTQNLSQQSETPSFNQNPSQSNGYGPFPGTDNLFNSSLMEGSAGSEGLTGLLRGLPLSNLNSLHLLNGSNLSLDSNHDIANSDIKINHDTANDQKHNVKTQRM